MKKKFGLALLALLSVGMVGCGNKNSDTGNVTDNTADTSSAEVKDEKLTITVSGNLKVGETVTFVAQYDGSPIVSQTTAVSYKASDATVMDITGNKATLKTAGTHSVRATYKTDAGTSVYNDFTVTVEDAAKAITIAEARALAKNDTYTPVLVRGVVQATSGTSAFIADSTGGIFIYNWYFATTDTASVSNYSWVLGMSVEVYAYVTAWYDAPQLCGSEKVDGKYVDLDNKYAVKIDDEINPIDATEIEEADLKAISAADTGKMYKMTAEFVSGSIVTTKKSTLTFKLGDTEFSLVTDGSSDKAYDKKIDALKASFDALGLKAGDKVDITAPLYSISYNKASFSYMSSGTVLSKHIEKDTLYVDYTGETTVGSTITLVSSYNGETVTDVTYSVTAGADLVTLEGNTVTLNSAGSVTIHAVYTVDGVEKTDDLTFVITSDKPVAINTLIANNDFVVKGVVSGTSTKGFMVTDATGSVYCHMNAVPTVAVGDVVKVAGSTSTYNSKSLQFNTPTVTKLDEKSDVVVPEAVKLTSEIADGFTSSTGAMSEIVKYKWTSTVSMEGSYYLLNVDGSDTKIEYSYYAGKLVSGTTYEFEGFFIGYNTSHNYATMFLTSVTEQAPTEVSVSLNKSSASVEVGKTVTLTANVKLPEDLTDNTVTWATDNAEVATVDDGVVTGVATGTATITATSVADPTKSASCTVTVAEPVAGTTVIDVDLATVFGTFTTAGDFTTTADDITYTLNGLYNSKYSQLRVYKGETLTISSTKYTFVKMEFTCTASGANQYGPGCFTVTDGNYTYEGTIGTWSNSTVASSVSFKAEASQVRITAIKLTVAEK